ncbi:PucR family transcriptional regulator ligand-binding domain-containing protein [Actinomadura madurae]|uniref:PucR family transcriptional regulator ligand-binding domain-containing protein n=1 Tax=Actinomadura madurae TaxID=1993 RepID=UPI0020D1F7C3|nr:PucR family transcriptional regulator ligand-binding domain-containing protein [Actinomadura madurae]MCQ0021143.1 PucR family transcriptional regulator ligand-binding domain-containing protein [Actinomadura madurae]
MREVLELPVLAAGSPIVRAAASGIGVPVHSVHVSELRNVAGTLTGNVLVLSVGLPMTEPGFDAPPTSGHYATPAP